MLDERRPELTQRLRYHAFVTDSLPLLHRNPIQKTRPSVSRRFEVVSPSRHDVCANTVRQKLNVRLDLDWQEIRESGFIL